MIDKSAQWFDRCGNFHEGFAKVVLDGKYNFINKNGEFLSEQWFDYCYDFHEGFAKVELDGKSNFINKKGKIIAIDAKLQICGFSEGFIKVRQNRNLTFNFINNDGEFLSNKWFDYCYDFHEGLAKVELNNKENFIDNSGNLLVNHEA